MGRSGVGSSGNRIRALVAWERLRYVEHRRRHAFRTCPSPIVRAKRLPRQPLALRSAMPLPQRSHNLRPGYAATIAISGRRPSRSSAVAGAYNATRRKLFSDKASLDLRPGEIPGFGGRSAAKGDTGQRLAVGSLEQANPQSSGWATPPRHSAFLHYRSPRQHGVLGAIRRAGCKSSPVIPNLGFPLGTRAQMFSLDPSHPGGCGAPQTAAHAAHATLALRDREPHLV